MMTAFLIYIIRWAVVLTLFYSLYGLFMKRETLHSVNRIVLLLILIASMLLPLCQIETREANIVAEGRELLELQFATASTIEFVPSIQTEETAKPQSNVNIVIFTLITIYIIGVVVAWVRYFWSLISLLLLIRKSRHIKTAGLPKDVKVLVNPSTTTPCSWMHWMLLSPADVQVQPIILHELSHIRLRHSWDMLLCELTCRMLWCVPFAWMLRQDLRDVHEYQADQRVLRSGVKDEEYQLLLIRKATDTGLQPVVNALNQSPIKKRFKMMYKKPSRRWVALKAAYLLPLGALSLMAFARPQALTEIEEKVEKEVTLYADAIKPLVNSYVADNTFPSTQTEKETPLATDLPKWTDTAGTIEMPDSNLVKADIGKQMTKAETAHEESVQNYEALLDSVMQAVGARKMAEGTYIGHFQPSLNNDTVKLGIVEFLNKESKKIFGQTYNQNFSDPYAYKMTIQAETRKERTGYYIRYLTPIRATDRNYDQPKYDTKLLPTDEVLVGTNVNGRTPIAIEQTKEETRVFMYITIGMPDSEEVPEMLMNSDICMFKLSNWVICDVATNDKYMFRSVDESYLRRVRESMSNGNRIVTYQVCLVFPPLDKKVKRIWIDSSHAPADKVTVLQLKDIPRKAQVFIN